MQKEVKEYNQKLIQEIQNKVDKYGQDEMGALICQDLLIRCLMEFNRLDNIGGEYQ